MGSLAGTESKEDRIAAVPIEPSARVGDLFRVFHCDAALRNENLHNPSRILGDAYSFSSAGNPDPVTTKNG